MRVGSGILHGMNRRTPTFSGVLAAISCFCCLLAAPRSVVAAPVAGLYEGTVVSSDRSPRGLAAVYPDALRQVAVRVTGRPGAATDPALAGLFADAARYVQTWRPAGAGQVAVGFDAQAVEAALVAAGQPLWPADRPTVLAVVLVEKAGPAGTVRTLVTGAVTGDDRRAVERVAQWRGLTVVWPGGEAATALVEVAKSGPVDALLAAAREQGAEAVLWVRTSAQAGMAPVWSWAVEGQVAAGRGDAGSALQAFADAIAAREASAPGAALAQVGITVTGVDTVADYAAVLNAIESQPTVRELAVVGVGAGGLRLKVRLRGDAAALARVLQRDGRLQAESGAGGADAGLRLRFGK